MNTKLQKQGNEQSILHFLSGGGEDVVLSGLRNRRWYYILHSEILSAQIVVYFLIMGL